jgi:hypothetical protein
VDTVPTNAPEREHRQAQALRGKLTNPVSDWVVDLDGPGPVQVLIAYRWSYKPRVAIAYLDSTGKPRIVEVAGDTELALASAAEIDAAVQLRSREERAAALEELAALVRRPGFPLPDGAEPIDVTVRLPSAEALQAAAAALGVPVDEQESQAAAVWPPRADGEPSPVEVLAFWRKPTPPPAKRPPARDWVRADQEPGRDSDEPGLETTQVIVPAPVDVGFPLGAGGYRLGRVAAAP